MCSSGGETSIGGDNLSSFFQDFGGGVTFNQGWTPDMMNIKERCEHVDVGELLCSQ